MFSVAVQPASMRPEPLFGILTDQFYEFIAVLLRESEDVCVSVPSGIWLDYLGHLKGEMQVVVQSDTCAAVDRASRSQ